MNDLPKRLEEIIQLLEHLTEPERREALIHYAAQANQFGPRTTEDYVVSDVRHDEQCIDSVGVFLLINNGCHFRISLGEKVQTLTRAISSILCQSLEAASPDTVLQLSKTTIDRLVGAELVRQRSQTVYYILDRMKEAIRESSAG